MKKHVLITAAMMLAASSLWAQQKPGTFSITPKVGITASNFSGDMPVSVDYAIVPEISTGLVEFGIHYPMPVAGSYCTWESKTKYGFTIGAEAQYQFTSRLGLSFGAFYLQQGASYDTPTGTDEDDRGVKMTFKDDLKINLNSIVVPVLLNGYIWKGLAIKTGIQPEIAVSKKTSGDVTISYEGQAVSAGNGDAENIYTYSLSIPVGLSYEYKNFVADLRYHVGLTNIRKGDSGWSHMLSSSSRNRTFFFTLGYKFGL